MTISRRGVTLIELMITTAIVTIAMLGVGVALVDTQRGWNKMYNRVHGEVATDSYVAKTVFDKNIREDVRVLLLDSVDELAGLPPDYIEAHQPGDDGKIAITTNYPDYVPFLTYAENEARRLELFKLFPEFPFKLQDMAHWLGFAFSLMSVHDLSGTEHRFLDLCGNDRADLSNVFTNGLDFEHGSHKKL